MDEVINVWLFENLVFLEILRVLLDYVKDIGVFEKIFVVNVFLGVR